MSINTPSTTRVRSKLPKLAALIGDTEMRNLKKLLDEVAEAAVKEARRHDQ